MIWRCENAMTDEERRTRVEAREAVQKIRREAELLRSAVADTRAHMEESRALLAQAPKTRPPG